MKGCLHISAALCLTALLLCSCSRGEIFFSPDGVKPLSVSQITQASPSAEIEFDDGGVMRSLYCPEGLEGSSVTDSRSAIRFIHSLSGPLGIADTPEQVRLDGTYTSTDGKLNIYRFIQSCGGYFVLDSRIDVVTQAESGRVILLTSGFLTDLQPSEEKRGVSVTQAFVTAEEELSLKGGGNVINDPLLAYFVEDGKARLVYSFGIYRDGRELFACVSDARTGELLRSVKGEDGQISIEYGELAATFSPPD